jgi:hypothetical protein
MGKQVRTWLDATSNSYIIPELDEDNLPVEESSTSISDPNFKIKKSSYPDYFNIKPLTGNIEYLKGTGEPVYDQESMQAASQSTLAKYTRGLVSRGASIAPKIGGFIGHIGGAISYGADYLIDPESADPNIIWDNAITRTMSSLDEGLRNQLPIYKSFVGRNGSLLQQMSDAGFWADDFFDSLAFLAAAYAVGGGIGAVVKGLKLTKVLTQGLKTYGATALNTVSEAGYETKDFVDQERDNQAYAKFGMSYEQLPDDLKIGIKLDPVITGAGARVFKGNMGVLLIPNYIQSRFMFGKVGDDAVNLRKLVHKGAIKPEDINIFRKSVSAGVLSMATEGPWEEGMQHALQTYSKRKESFGQTWDDYALGVLNDWAENWTTVEGQKNMILGTFIGGAFGFGGGAREGLGERELIKDEEDIWNKVKPLLNQYNSWYNEHTTVPFKEFEITTFKEDDNGNKIEVKTKSLINPKTGYDEFDEEKLQRMFMYMYNNKFLYDESMIASMNNDNMHLQLLQNDAMARMYYNYATTEGISSLDEVDELILERELEIPKELEERGLKKKYTKADLAQYRKAYEDAVINMMSPEDFKNEPLRDRFNSVLIKTLFGEQVKRNYLESSLSNPKLSEQQRDDVNRMIEDSKKMSDELTKKPTRDKLYEDYKDEYKSREEIIKRITELSKDPKATEDQRLRAQFENDEYIFINGQTSPFSTKFAYDVEKGSELAEPFGSRYNYFQDIGNVYAKKAKLNSLIEKTKQRKDPGLISDVVNQFASDLKQGTRYNKEDLDKVEKILNDREAGIKRSRSDIDARKYSLEVENAPMVDQFDENGIPLMDKVPNEKYDPAKAKRDAEVIENYNNKVLDWQQAKKVWDESILGVELPTQEKDMKNHQRAYRSFQREFADEPVKKAQDLINKFSARKDVGLSDTEVSNIISKLKDIKKVYSQPGRKKLLTSREFKARGGLIENIDEVLSQLEPIKIAAEEAKYNRDIKDKATRENYSETLFKSIGVTITNGVPVIDRDNLIYKTIGDIIGFQILDKIIHEASTASHEGEDMKFDSIFVEKILLQVRGAKKGPERLNKILKELYKNRITAFEELYKSLNTLSAEKYIFDTKSKLSKYKQNPYRVFDIMLDFVVDRKRNQTETLSALDKFIRNKDIFELYNAISNGEKTGYTEISEKELLDLLNAHINVLSISLISDRINSGIGINEILKLEDIALQSDIKTAPSNQQNISLREAIVDFHTPVKNKEENFSGWSYLKGLAGSGKTQLFVKVLTKLLDIKESQIIALSTHKNALSVLKASIPGVSKTYLHTDLKEEDLKNEENKVLFVDEITRLNMNDMYAIAEMVAKANKERKEALHVYIMGDPSQVTDQESRHPAINNTDKENIRIKEFSPLTAVFRSGNNALLYLMDTFLDFNKEVKTLVVNSSNDIGKVSDGVHISTMQEVLLNQLEISKGSNRTKVIVVGTEQQKLSYKNSKQVKDNSQVEVMTYWEVAGLSFDEVYIDINPELFGDNYSRMNEAMYTSVSRANNYVFLRSYRSDGGWKSTQDNLTSENIKERNDKLLSDYTSRLTFEHKVLGEEMKNVKVETKSNLEADTKTQEQLIEDQGNQNPQDEEYNSSPVIAQDETDWLEEEDADILYPTYGAILADEEGIIVDPKTGKTVRLAPVRNGSRVRYIKTFNTKEDRPEIQIIAEELNIDGTPKPGKDNKGLWRVIGIVSQEELTTSKGLKLQKQFDKAVNEEGEHYYTSLTLGKTGHMRDADPGVILMEGVIHKSRPLTYKYANKLTIQGRGLIAKLQKKVENVFSSPTPEFHNYRIHIYSIKDSMPNVIPGVPYLEIIRFTTKNGVRQEEPSVMQRISLSGRMLRQNDKFILPLIDFRTKIVELNAILNGKAQYGESGVNKLIKNFSKNFRISDKDEYKIEPKDKKEFTYEDYNRLKDKVGFPEISEPEFNKIDKLSADIIPMYYGKGTTNVEVESEEEMNQKYHDTQDEIYEFKKHDKSDSGYVLIKKKGDTSGKGIYLTEEGLVAAEGPVQFWLDILAKTNPNAQWTVRRPFSKMSNGKMRKIYITNAKHLFAEQETHGAYLKYLSDLITKTVDELGDTDVDMNEINKWIFSKKIFLDERIAKLEGVILGDLKLYNTTTLKLVDREELNRIKVQHGTSITIDTLNDILDFDEKGNHKSMYLPIKAYGEDGLNEMGKDDESINRNRMKLEDMLATKFEDLSKTRIQVKINEPSEPKKTSNKIVEGVKKAVTDINSIKERISRRERRLMSSLSGRDKGNLITFKEAHALLEKLVPSISKEGKDVLRFVDHMLMQELAGEDAYGLYRDEVIYGLNVAGKTYDKPIRHEAGHKIFFEYLTQKEKDALIKAYRKQFPEHKDKSTLDIEELIFGSFGDYQSKKLTGINKVLMDFYNWLSRIFSFMNQNVKDLDRFFETIESGYFVKNKGNGIDITRSMKNIMAIYGYKGKGFHHALDVYKNARAIIQDEVAFFREYGNNGFPLIRREINSIVKQKIETIYRSLVNDMHNIDITKEERLTIAKESLYFEKALNNYDRIIKDIYPNWSFDNIGEIVVDENVSTEEIIELYKKDSENVNLKNHIIESDEVNHESSQSKTVKDILSNILMDSMYMSWREAYIRTLQLLQGLQINNELFSQQLEDNYKLLGSHPRTKALYDVILKMYENANTRTYGSKGLLLSKNHKFVDEDTFVSHDRDLSDVSGAITVEQLGGKVYRRGKSESTREFIIRISTEDNLMIPEVTGQFNYFQNVDNFKSLINFFNNQKEKNIYIVENKQGDWGTYSISYFPGSYIGAHKSLASTLEDKFTELFKTKAAIQNFNTVWLTPNKKMFSNNHYQFVKEFLKYIGMGPIALEIPNVGIERIYNDIIFFFDRAEKQIGETAKRKIIKEDIDENTGADLLNDTVEYTVEIEDVLDEPSNRSLIPSLSKLMANASSYIRATNVRDVKGKRKYMWNPTSNAHDILYNFVNNSIFNIKNIHSGKIKLRLPVYFNNKFYKLNSFVSGKNTILDIIDNDGIKETNWTGTYTGITLKDEDTKDFLIRNFVAGFIDRINHSTGGKESYFQFIYPNERTSTFGAKVRVLTMDKATDSIKDMIRQVQSRESIANLAEYKKNKFTNFSLFRQVIGNRDITANPLSEKEIDKTSAQIIDLLKKEAEKLTKTIIDQKVPFDSKTFAIKALNKLIPGYDVSVFQNGEIFGKVNTQSIKDKEYQITGEMIYPIAELFMVNQYTNSYFLNQLIVGDYAQFKNEEDVMRRLSLSTAPGSRPLVNNVFGMKESSKFLMVQDEMRSIKDIRDRIEALLKTPKEKENIDILMSKFKDNFASSDGQGFMTMNRYEQLKNKGFNQEFPLGYVLKPVIFTRDNNGVSRAVKYASIVLTPELMNVFPSLSVLNDNLNTLGMEEMVFRSGVKEGQPVDGASYLDLLTKSYAAEDIPNMDTMTYEVMNNDYRIQLDPKASIEGSTRQPSQLLYLAGVYENNIDRAAQMYESFRNISQLGGKIFSDMFPNASGVYDNISKIINENGNERLKEMIRSGLSLNFPVISDKAIIQMAANLQKNIVDIRWPGTKLVLQSEYGIRKFGDVAANTQNSLKFYRNKDNRMVAEVILPEGLLPKEYEDEIKTAIKEGRNADDYFDLPDLLGFRIPSSDIHSGVAMKVTGFYSSKDTNVIIAPDLLVALHGSDFDVDSLFIIRRSTYKNNKDLIGYSAKSKKDRRLSFNRNMSIVALDIEDQISFHKNAILESLLDMISSEDNVETMLSPIPLKRFQEARDTVKELRSIETSLDLSNFNNAITSHDTIFGAATATGIFGNAAKGIAMMLRTGKKNSMPKLREGETIININGKNYKEVTLDIKNEDNLFVFLDGLINASIDNIRELILPVLNINKSTIPALIGLRTLGVPFNTIVKILQQPSVLDYAKTGNLNRIKTHITDLIGQVDVLDQEINDELLDDGIVFESTLESIEPIDNENIDQDKLKRLSIQLKVLLTVEQAGKYGKRISDLASFLSIAREIPVVKKDIDKKINDGEKIFGPIDEDSSLPGFKDSSFPFDIENFFVKNVHILEIYNQIKSLKKLIESTFKKYNPVFQSHVEEIYSLLGGQLNMTKEEGLEYIRTELLNYMISNEIYSGEYKLDQKTQYTYNYRGEDRVLTGPKAINQIFINKIIAVKNYMLHQKNSKGESMHNQFLEHISYRFNNITRTKELYFEGGTNIDQMDLLNFREAFLMLNQYEVTWDTKTQKAKVVVDNTPKSDVSYSDFQKEFVSYGVMNWGLNFGVQNYSFILPEDLYKSVDIKFNNLIDRYLGRESGKKQFEKIRDDFMLQFVTNNESSMIGLSVGKYGKAVKQGSYITKKGHERSIYSGEENGYKFDRKFVNENNNVFPEYIVAGYDKEVKLYLRLNEGGSEIVYYTEIGYPNTLKFYNTTDKVITEGFDKFETYGGPIRNFRVSDVNNPQIYYPGKDVKKGDIITVSVFHDITRENKVPYRVKKILDGNFILEKVKETINQPQLTQEPEVIDKETHDSINKINEVMDHYTSFESIGSLIDTMISRSNSQRMIKLLGLLKEKIIAQDLSINFGYINGKANGHFTLDGGIKIDLARILTNRKNLNYETVDKVIFHEMVHGVTVVAALENEKFRNSIEDILARYFKKNKDGRYIAKDPRMQEIMDKYSEGIKEIYGFKDIREFIAELFSNDYFANVISNIRKETDQKSLLRRIIDKIMEWLGYPNRVNNDFEYLITHSPYAENLELVDDGLYEKIYRNKQGKEYAVKNVYSQEEETELEEKKSIFDEETSEIRKKSKEILNNILIQSEKIKVIKDDSGKETNNYSIVGTLKTLLRITDRAKGPLSFFSNTKIDPNVSFGQHMADLRWDKKSHDTKLQTDEGNMETYDEYRLRMENSGKMGSIKGRIMHLYLKRIFNKYFNLGMIDSEILKEINNVASESDGKISITDYQWLNDKEYLEKILTQAGINIMDEVPENLKDVMVSPEISVWSDLLGWGGTMDALVTKASGRFSIIDWKTGRRFGLKTNPDPMKYGIQSVYISDNQRERAKLQVMLYAFILKLNNPDIKFENLLTVWIPDRWFTERVDTEKNVEVSAYLNMLKSFFSDKKAIKEAGLSENILETIMEKSPRIFDVSEYTDKTDDSMFSKIKDDIFRPEIAYRKRVEEITAILSQLRDRRQIRTEELPEWQKLRLAKLMEEVAQLKADPSMQLDVFPEGDIGIVKEYLGNYSDINMGIFQTWVKLRNERWNLYTQKHERDKLEFNEKMKSILNEYMKNKFQVKMSSRIVLGNINYAELFSFAFKEELKNGFMIERLITKEDKQEWSNLTKDQQSFMEYINNKFASWFVGDKAFMNQKATMYNHEKLTWLNLFNLGKSKDRMFEWYQGFFPKVMKTDEELNYEEGVRILGENIGKGDVLGANILGRFSTKVMKEKAIRALTRFEDDVFEQYNESKMALPLKYLDSFNVVNERNYTKNIVFMFDRFNKSMLHKEYMEEVYHTGQALKVYLQLKKNGEGQPMFENTVGFLEKKLVGDLQNRIKRMKLLSLPFTIGTYNIDLEKIIESLGTWTSQTIMWLKPLQGTGNALHAKSLVYREGLKGSIASSFAHIDGDAIDFKVSDVAFADIEYFQKFLPDIFTNKMDQNKLFLLARKLNYVPDNYDYATNRKFLLSSRNELVSQSSMYMFHSKPEEYISLTTMAAQLHYLKNPVTGKSLWDSYEVQKATDGSYDVQWVGGVRGTEKTGKGMSVSYNPITGLTDHEIAKLKKVHERMQGGYRKEEAGNLEIYVLGKSMIQFKKYLPRLMMNALGSKMDVVDLGYYKKLAETRIDPKTGKKMDVYEWTHRMNEGRWRTLANHLLSYIGLTNGDYKWDQLSTEQKQNIIDAMITLNMFALSLAMYTVMFGDEPDDDTAKKWWNNYLVMNMSQQYNPLDMLNSLEAASRPVALARMYKMTQASWIMTVALANLAVGDNEDAFTQKGDLKGWNEFMKGIPGLASYSDLASKLGHSGGELEEWWENKMDRKWR